MAALPPAPAAPAYRDASRSVLDGAPLPVVVASLVDGTILYANPAVLRIMGERPERALGRPAIDYWVDPDQRAAVMARLRAEGEVHDAEIRARRADGSIAWLQLSVSIVDYEGRPASCTTFADVTELKEAQARLQESQLRMELALQGGGLGTWDWDLTTGRMRFDEHWAAITGRRGDEVPRDLAGWKALVHPDDLAAAQAVLRDYVAGRIATASTEHRLRHVDGHWVWVLGTGRVVARAADGTPLRAAGTLQDVTAVKAAERALRESEQKHRLLVENSHDIIYTLDTQGVITFASPSYQVMLGWPVEEVVGQHFARFTHPDDVARCQAFLELVVRSGERHGHFEHRVLHRDGTWHWVSTNAAPFRDAEGRLVGLEGSASDVEERKALQARAARAERAASLGTMAAGMAHEINNPLTYAISGLQYAEERLRSLPASLRATWPAAPEGGLADLEEALTEASQGARRVRDLVADLRALAAGQHSEDARCDLAGALARAARVAGHAFRAGTAVTLDLPALPSIQGSEAELVQLFSALLINAGQACGGQAGAVRVEAGRRGEQVVVRVVDQGHGMPPGLLGRAFDPFVTTREVGSGRGLGLTVALAIARGLGGDVEASSEEGRGTTVTVTLPVAR